MFFALLTTASAGPDIYGFGGGRDHHVTISGAQTSPMGRVVQVPAPAGSHTVEISGVINPGVLVLVHQTAGGSATPLFDHDPEPLDLIAEGIGHYEFARVVAYNAPFLTLDSPLDHDYGTGAQVVAVREYTSLTVPVGNSINVPYWNGQSGGVMAVMVDGVLDLDGIITGESAGFAGAAEDDDYSTACESAGDDESGGPTGEGLAGVGVRGRSSHANAGGGGSCDDAGGAGGGSSGRGGRGGLGHPFQGIIDAGGFPGAGTVSAWDSALTLGGGGGAGDMNGNPDDTAGARGGGLILIRAREITGHGSIRAQGNSATDNGLDGAGGGGGGGTVILRTLEGISCGGVDVSGGDGGNTSNVTGNHGPGGGGGGGLVVFEGGGHCESNVTGGDRGTSGGSTHGAESGAVGSTEFFTASAFADTDGDGSVVGPGGLGPDCDDGNPHDFPGAVELCDGRDNDCDGDTDEDDSLDAPAWFFDEDGDDFGTGIPIYSCSQPNGYVSNDTDCNDHDADISPAEQDDTCDGVDNNCNQHTDEDAIGVPWYEDLDGDHAGGALTHTQCLAPSDHHTLHSGDCDDHNSQIYPGADEFCDNTDNDCDHQVDEDPVDGSFAFFDGDGDLHGAGNPIMVCTLPAHYVLGDEDCDDHDPTVHPGAADDTCDGVNNDCDGAIDEDAHGFHWFLDDDGDGFHGTVTHACIQPAHTLAIANDCDDDDDLVYPDAPERCNGHDDDCDGHTDEEPVDGDPYYQDADDDGFGDGPQALFCDMPAGWVDNADDCDDADDSIHPDAHEACNLIDDDCDGHTDEHVQHMFWPDDDDDGFGRHDGDFTLACTAPHHFVDNSGDCNDELASVNPSEMELCNGIDDNCNHEVDEGHPPHTIWFIDADGDGVGDEHDSGQASCDPPAETGYVQRTGDCDDTNHLVTPDTSEICNNAIDDDCDHMIDAGSDVVGGTTSYPDADGDGFGPDTPITTCTVPAGNVETAGDCDDADDTIHPDATEICDGVDNDCNDLIDAHDPHLVITPTWIDADGDGFGGLHPALECTGVPNHDDCDDANPLVNPDAIEVLDGIDNDCDSDVDELDRHTGDTGDTDLPVDTDDTDVPGDTDGAEDADLPYSDTGCACSSTGPPPWIAGMLGLLLVGARRRG